MLPEKYTKAELLTLFTFSKKRVQQSNYCKVSDFIYFYRDKDMNEIDLVIEDGGTLYPVEMKKHADPLKRDVQVFSVLDKIPGIQRGSGGVVCLYDRLITLQGNDKVIPVAYL